jgi:hypothetical protein
MQCCANCFGDGHLRLEVIPSLSEATGDCSYCGSKNLALVCPIKLREQFELLTSIYVRSDDGITLVEWLQKDWALFRHPQMNVAHAKELLAEILDDGDIVRKKFIPSAPSTSDALQRWDALRLELMHSNRFFPRTEINLERLKRLFGFLLLKDAEIPKSWYRARIQQGAKVYEMNEMGAPPKNLATHGRANPAGIPYLYLASTELTAVSEIRPHTGEEASVAEFIIPDGLSIADLRDPRLTVSPFILSDESEISLLRQDIEFLEKLGEELTRPVIPRSAAFDYIPSQYLCEYVKVCGYDGVMYRSSVGDGINVALFDPGRANGVSVRSLKVSRVLVNLG